MSYFLQAIAGTNASTPDVSVGLTLIKLTEDVWMAPLSSDVRDRYGIALMPFDDGDCDEVPDALNTLCCASSQHGLTAYLEAAFWGGEGIQASVLFKNGAAIERPVIARDAINRALRLLGIAASGGRDEFATVDLGRYRETDKWV